MNSDELFSPTLADLVATVRDFLKDGRAGYEMQVARYLLDMTLRELERGPALEKRSAERMKGLLGAAAKDTGLVAQVGRAIRAGRFDERLPEVLAVLLDEAVERVSIVRPDVLDRGSGSR